MKPKEILKMIEKGINGDWSITNLHDCDLRKCLVRPRKRNLQYADEIKEYWIVLEEDPINFEGFKIFFDEENNRFGLAGYGSQFDYVCNFHDTFLDAFKSM